MQVKANIRLLKRTVVGYSTALAEEVSNKAFEGLAVLAIVVAMALMSFHSGGHIFFGAGSFIGLCLSAGLVFIGGWRFLTIGKVRLFSMGGVVLPWAFYVCINCMLLSHVPWDGSVELLAYGCALTVYVSVLYLSPAGTRRLFDGLLIVGGIVILFALLQVVIGASWHPLGGVGSVRAQYGERLSSVFSMPNSFACFVLMLLPYALLKAFCGKKWCLLNGLIAFLLMFCLVASVSRAAIFSGVFVLVATCFLSSACWRQRLIRLASLLLVYGVLYWVVVSRTESSSRFSQLVENGGEVSRRVYFAAASSLFEGAPVWGVGVGNFQVLWDRQFPVSLNFMEKFVHSDYLQVLCETGVVGFGLLFGGGVWVLLRAVRGILKSEGDILEGEALIVKASLCGLLGFSMHELVNFESKLLCVLLLASVYFAVLVRFVSVEKVLCITRRWRVVCAGVWLGFMVFLFGFFGLVRSVWYSSEGEFRAGKVFGFHSIGVPAPEGELELAEVAFRKSTELDSGYMPAYWYLARLKLSHRFYSDQELSALVASAVVKCDEAIELCPLHWRLWADRGVMLSMDPSRELEAKASFEKMLELAPNHARALEKYARYLEERDELDERAVLKEVLEKIILIDDCNRLDMPWPKEALSRLNN